MKTKLAYLIYIITCILILNSCKTYEVTNSIIGNWTQTKITSIRYKSKKQPYNFVFSKNPVELNLTINKNGTIEGFFRNIKI